MQNEEQSSGTSCEMILSEMYNKYNTLREDFSSLSGCTPDMLWAKDLEGVYTYANSKVAWQLYRTTPSYMLGKTDHDLAAACKERQGPEKFTFGAMCADSDGIVVESERPVKFLERGLVDGKELVLMVHKNVKRHSNTGKITGTVGIGRDTTDDVHRLEKLVATTEDSKTREELKSILGEYYYPNKEMVGEHL